jgi:PAS domain S-box-containing protein
MAEHGATEMPVEATERWPWRVIEVAHDGIVTVDAAARVVQLNPAAEQMFGYSRDEVVGRPVADLMFPPDSRAAAREALGLLLAGEDPGLLDRRIELMAMRRDGSTVTVELIVTRSSDDPPLLTAFVCDMDALWREEGRRTRTERLLSRAERVAGMGSWELSLATRRLTFSAGLFRIHGYEPGAFQPSVERVQELVHPDDRPGLGRLVETVLEHPEQIRDDDHECDYRALWPDGSSREVQARGRIEENAEGRPVRFVGTVRDVTAQRSAERELDAVHAVSRSLRAWTSSDPGLVDLLRDLARALHFPIAALWVPDDQGRLHCRAFWSADGVDVGDFEVDTRRTTFAPGQGVLGRVWLEGRAVIVPDVREYATLERRPVAIAAGLRSALVFPASGPAGPVAALSFYSLDPRPPNERLARTLEDVGRTLGRFLEARKAELGPQVLSPRELEVLRLAAEGRTGREIAEELVLSPTTVKTHFGSIYDKLGVSDRASAVAHGFRIGLLR